MRLSNVSSPFWENQLNLLFNYALQDSGLDQRETVCQDVIESINNNFYMDDYLKSSS